MKIISVTQVAKSVPFDNEFNEFESEDVQAAIEEIKDRPFARGLVQAKVVFDGVKMQAVVYDELIIDEKFITKEVI